MRNRFFFLGLFLVSIGIPVAFIFYPSYYQVTTIIQFLPFGYSINVYSLQLTILTIIGSIMSAILGLGFILYSILSKPPIKEIKFQSINNCTQERNQAQANKELNPKGIKNILGGLINLIIGSIIISIGYYVIKMNKVINTFYYLVGIGVWTLIGIILFVYGIYLIIHKLRIK